MKALKVLASYVLMLALTLKLRYTMFRIRFLSTRLYDRWSDVKAAVDTALDMAYFGGYFMAQFVKHVRRIPMKVAFEMAGVDTKLHAIAVDTRRYQKLLDEREAAWERVKLAAQRVEELL